MWAPSCDSSSYLGLGTVAGTETRHRLLLDQTFLARRFDVPSKPGDGMVLAPDAVLGILAPFGEGEDFVFAQLGELLYYDGDDWNSITEDNADYSV
jgi:hypothetical protein